MSRSRTTPFSPTRHTAVIADVPGMFWKLAWDIDQFDKIQRDDPDLVEPLAYAAINVCISAWSLREWVVAEFVSKRRAAGKKTSKKEVIAHIHQAVLAQPMCEAIADTAKHSRFSEGMWNGGFVRVDFDEACEDNPGGLVLRHIHEDGAYTSIALNAFASLERCWWGELQTLGFVFPHIAPEWRQRRFREAFGVGSEWQGSVG